MDQSVIFNNNPNPLHFQDSGFILQIGITKFMAIPKDSVEIFLNAENCS